MIYFIASRLNAQEYLLMSSRSPLGPFYFDTLDQAKRLFGPFYKILSTEKITSELYLETVSKLINIHPVIIGLKYDKNKVLSKIRQWQDGTMTYTCVAPIIPLPHLITAMKTGFIDTYQELDILRDIESMTRIDSEGRVEIVQFNISSLERGNCNTTIELLTEDKAQEILRKRGFI